MGRLGLLSFRCWQKEYQLAGHKRSITAVVCPPRLKWWNPKNEEPLGAVNTLSYLSLYTVSSQNVITQMMSWFQHGVCSLVLDKSTFLHIDHTHTSSLWIHFDIKVTWWFKAIKLSMCFQKNKWNNLAQKLAQGRDFGAIAKTLPRLLEGLHLVWNISMHYKRGDHMEALMERIAWQVCESARHAVNMCTLFRYGFWCTQVVSHWLWYKWLFRYLT